MPHEFASIAPRHLRDHGRVDQQIRSALAMAQRCSLADIPAMLSEIDKLRGTGGVALDILEHALVARWVEADPTGALSKALADGPNIRPFLFIGLAVSHPDGLLDRWAEVQKSLATQPELGKSVVQSILNAAPEKAADLLASLQQDPTTLASAALAVLWHLNPEEAKRSAVADGRVNDILDLWKAEDPTAACRWALESVPTGLNPFRLGEWVQTDLPGVLKYLDLEASPDARDALLRPISMELGKSDPKAGIDWLLTQPATSGRTRAMAQNLVDWVLRDGEAASSWLSEQPPSNDTDVLVRAFSHMAERLDPPMAFSWAATITDPQIRDQTLDRNFNYWRREDPQAARAWLDSNPEIPTELLQKWRKDL